ncbi:9367_t:CDS:2 [Ambispora gerdemannii]|uniref:9367_t:CDS:1 n=1 Tax=Ambispora gerdemannii TaxID=144530 RepID=A0A9N9GWY4_9GLOM|nr:9367_t:CDS:2 [Ambispora gerdemannii]
MADHSPSSSVAQDHWAATWIPASNGQLSPNAFNYYRQHIGRGDYEGGVHPGFIINQGLHIAFRGKEIILKNYQVLSAKICGSLTSVDQAQDQFKWKAFHGEVRPQFNIPLKAGHEKDGKELYIARIRHGNDGYIYGKAGRHLIEGAAYAFLGKEYRALDYEVLVFQDNE